MMLALSERFLLLLTAFCIVSPGMASCCQRDDVDHTSRSSSDPSKSTSEHEPPSPAYIPRHCQTNLFNEFPQESDFSFINNKGSILGMGDTSIVIRVLHEPTRSSYALKVIDAENVLKTAERIAQEERIHHLMRSEYMSEHYCSFLGADGSAFHVMELIEGRQLGALLHPHAASELSRERIVLIFGQILEGLHYIHKKSVAHQEIWPENIIITEADAVKIVDFNRAVEEDAKEYKARAADYCAAGAILVGLFKNAMEQGADAGADPGIDFNADVSAEQSSQPRTSLTDDAHFDDLINLLCEPELKKRWNNAFVKYDEVLKKHHFFEGYRWDSSSSSESSRDNLSSGNSEEVSSDDSNPAPS